MSRWKLLLVLFVFLIPFSVAEVSEEQALSIAQNEFNSTVSSEKRYEFIYIGIERDRIIPEFYKVKWERKINGIRVSGEGLVISIDSTNGNIVNKHYAYSYPASQVDTTQIITSSQSKFVVQRNIGPITKESGLEIHGNKLYWIFIVKGGNWIRVDAKTGFAETYEWALGSGSEGTAQFNPTQYYLETYGLYFALIIILLGGFAYWKFILPKKK